MQEAERTELERGLRECWERADHARAATLLLRGYGQEILGFLRATHRAEEADDVFSLFAQEVWKSLPAFAWESSARVWAYAVARHVSKTFLRNEGRRRRRILNRTDSFFEQVVQQVRTETSAFRRTGKRTRLQSLRDALPEDDRALLVLRVDRRLEWRELARVFSSARKTEPLDDEALDREAARLRKRFQLVKNRLRELAKREGLGE